MNGKTINSFTDFIKFIEKECEDDNTLFRGQREDLPLLPKIARINLRDDLLNSEKKIFDDFKRRSIPFLGYSPQNDWDWIALAQHYGLPTRLLDWTLNPLAALWFAVNKESNKDEITGLNKDGVIWIFQANDGDYADTEDIKSKPFNQTITKVFQPKILTGRINTQSGWFTIHKYNSERKGFVKFETNLSYKNKLKKLIIPAKSFSDIRYQLDRCGTNSSSLFPDLDGLCSHIQWMYSLLDDEEE